MAHTPSPGDIDPRELDRAQGTWHGFTQMVKWNTVAIIIVLALMAAFLV